MRGVAQLGTILGGLTKRQSSFFLSGAMFFPKLKNTIDWQAQVFGYNIVQCRHPMLRNTGYIYLEIFESSLFASLLIRIKLINCNEGNFYMTTCSLG